jgi:hypothetical protein
MDREEFFQWLDIFDEIGIRPEARRDAMSRAERHFAQQATVLDWERRDFAEGLRREAPHFFRSAGPQQPQATRLSPDEEKLPPQDRLTKWREKQEQAR